MKASDLMVISFGCTLALVVGLRLNTTGLLLVATALFSALLLCPLFALRIVTTGGAVWAPDVQIEPVTDSDLDDRQAGRRALPEGHTRRTRRGGWPHLAAGWGSRENDRPVFLAHAAQGGHHAGTTVDG